MPYAAFLGGLEEAADLDEFRLDVGGRHVLHAAGERLKAFDRVRDLIRRGKTSEQVEREPRAAPRELHHVEAPQELATNLLDFGDIRPLAEQFANDDFDEHGLGVVEALERPAVEPQAGNPPVGGHARLHHRQHARLPGAPVAVNADGQRILAVVL